MMTDKRPEANLPLKFILGVNKSRLERFYFEPYVIDQSLGGGLIHATPGTHDKLIVPKTTDKYVDRLVALVDKMLALTPKLRGASSESEKAALQNAVTTTDAEIDRLVYVLYGLTEDEIKIVEGEC